METPKSKGFLDLGIVLLYCQLGDPTYLCWNPNSRAPCSFSKFYYIYLNLHKFATWFNIKLQVILFQFFLYVYCFSFKIFKYNYFISYWWYKRSLKFTPLQIIKFEYSNMFFFTFLFYIKYRTSSPNWWWTTTEKGCIIKILLL